ncbi:hypothetical protein L0337_23110 [candidate division KSB1 bacterium]|nr:hypothetical protein [candidate division KSB1 bacterium]
MSETHNMPTHTDNGSGHEESDANVSAVTKFGIGLAIISAVVLVLMVWLQNFFNEQTKRATPPPSPLMAERQLPPGPRLQVAPAKDLDEVRAAEDSVLNSYGWVVRDGGVVRIPIDRAIELVVQRGLPVRSAGEMEDEKSGAQLAKIGNGGVQP